MKNCEGIEKKKIFKICSEHYFYLEVVVELADNQYILLKKKSNNVGFSLTFAFKHIIQHS